MQPSSRSANSTPCEQRRSSNSRIVEVRLWRFKTPDAIRKRALWLDCPRVFRGSPIALCYSRTAATTGCLRFNGHALFEPGRDGLARRPNGHASTRWHQHLYPGILRAPPKHTYTRRSHPLQPLSAKLRAPALAQRQLRHDLQRARRLHRSSQEGAQCCGTRAGAAMRPTAMW